MNMLTNNQKNEFDEMKSQMQVLKNHLSDSEIVSREMLDATIKSSAKNLISKRLWNIVAIVAVLLMAGFIAYVCLSLHKCSVLFMAATIVWCVFLALVNFRTYVKASASPSRRSSGAPSVSTKSGPTSRPTYLIFCSLRSSTSLS